LFAIFTKESKLTEEIKIIAVYFDALLTERQKKSIITNNRPKFEFFKSGPLFI